MLQTLGNLFNTLFMQPILNVLVIFYDLFASLGLPGAFGFSIIAITVLIRFMMHPFFQKQMETAKVMKELKPKLDKLKKKYKDKPQKLQKEQLKLYQEAGINPASGCLFAIVQIPLIYGLFRTLQMFLVVDTEGKVVQQINEQLYHPALQIQSIDPTFFIYNIALPPSQAGIWYYYLIPVVTAALQYFQTRVTMTQNPMTDVSEVKDKTDKTSDSEGKEESSTGEEFQKAMNTQMKYFFPIMVGYFAYTLPLGLSLYWNTFSLFSIIQHYMNERKS